MTIIQRVLYYLIIICLFNKYFTFSRDIFLWWWPMTLMCRLANYILSWLELFYESSQWAYRKVTCLPNIYLLPIPVLLRLGVWSCTDKQKVSRVNTIGVNKYQVQRTGKNTHTATAAKKGHNRTSPWETRTRGINNQRRSETDRPLPQSAPYLHRSASI